MCRMLALCCPEPLQVVLHRNSTVCFYGSDCMVPALAHDIPKESGCRGFLYDNQHHGLFLPFCTIHDADRCFGGGRVLTNQSWLFANQPWLLSHQSRYKYIYTAMKFVCLDQSALSHLTCAK